MVLGENGKLYAFGDNRYGQLGIRGLDAIVLTSPEEVQTPFRKVKDFACGEEHAAFVDEKGNAYTWGCGLSGQLGHGDTNNQAKPQKVQLSFPAKLVACGGAHTAIVSETDDVWMCGRGRDGQLGAGDTDRAPTFQRTQPEKMRTFVDSQSQAKGTIQDIQLGSNHSIAHIVF